MLKGRVCFTSRSVPTTASHTPGPERSPFHISTTFIMTPMHQQSQTACYTHTQVPRQPWTLLQTVCLQGHHSPSSTLAQAPHACSEASPSSFPLCPKAFGQRRSSTQTCYRYVANALLVHSWHQDHRLGWHHHGSRQRLKHTKDNHGVREEDYTTC